MHLRFVAVPTPVDDAHIPDFRPLVGASRAIGPQLKKGATVIYESTVYPGASHSFLEAMSIAEVARRAIADGAAWVKAKLRA